MRVPLPRDELSILTLASRRELLAHLSHDLRAPVRTVLGSAELLALTSLTADQRRHVDLLTRAGEQLLVLANELAGVQRDASPQAAREPPPQGAPDEESALTERFLAHRAREVVTARAALRRGDFEFLLTLGHNLRGNGVSSGFPRLSVLGWRIEQAARARQEGDMEGLLEQLAAAVAEAAGAGEPRGRARSGTHARLGPLAQARHTTCWTEEEPPCQSTSRS